MNRHQQKFTRTSRLVGQSGFTMIELMLTIIISSIILLSICIFMMNTQRSWNDVYAKVCGGAVDDSIVAKAAFDKIVRKSSKTSHQLLSPDDLRVFYYEDWEDSTALDRRAHFYRSLENPSEMYVEHTTANGQDILSTVLLATHVTNLEFIKVDDGYTMNLSLDDGREQIMVVSTAFFHN